MAESKTKGKEIHLIKLDIDGTSTNPDFSTLNKDLKEVLQELKKQGHKICFTTGRNYWSALPFYNEVGLDTFLVTYNGAYINNPAEQNDKEAVVVNQISNQVVKNILAEPIIKKNLLNILVDRVDKKIISTSDDVYYQEIFFNGNNYTKADIPNLLEHLGNKGALQLVLEFPSEKETFYNILIMLNSKYGERAISFYFGSKLKSKKPGDKILVPDPTKNVIKIRSKMASKGKGVECVASQYNIPSSPTLTFGNDVNDIEMMHTALGRGIVMADSDPYLIPFARGITDFGMHGSDGVAKRLAE